MLIFQNSEFLSSVSRIIDVKFDGSLFIRQGIIASNICPLIPYGIIPDTMGLYAQVTLTTPPRYVIPPRFASWNSTLLYTNIIHTNSYSLHRSALRNIQKAEKAGIVVEPSTEIAAFYTLFCQTFELQGLDAPVTERQMKDLFAVVCAKKAGELLVAKTSEGRIVSGQLLLWDDEQGHAWLNATDHDYLKVGTNYLVIREAIESIKSRGLDEFDVRMGNVERFDAFARNFSPERVAYYKLKKYNNPLGHIGFLRNSLG